MVKGLPEALKALKSISDAVTKTEQKSVAATKAGTTERQKQRKKEQKESEKAIAQTSDMLKKAEKAGSDTLSKELKTRLTNQLTHYRTNFKEHQKHLDDVRKSADRSQKAAHDNVTKYWNAEIKQADRLAAHKKALRERIASDNGKFARQEASREAIINRNFHLEMRKNRLAILRGEAGAEVSLSPHARLGHLRRAERGSIGDKKIALEQARDMAEENKARLVGLKKKVGEKELIDHTHIQKEMTRQEEAEAKRRLALRERIASDNGKFAAKQAREEAAARKEVAQTVMRGAGAGVQSATTIGGAVARSVLNLGGGLSVQDAMQDRLSLEHKASLLSVAAKTGDHPERVDPKSIVNRVKAASVSTNMDTDELMEGLNAFTARTGEYKEGAKNLDFFGKISKTTGTSIKDVMKTAGTLRVQNKNLKEDEMKSLLLSTIMQARQGSVEFEDMARAGGKITRSSGAYVGSQKDNQRDLMGLAQISMRTGGSVEEGATMLSNISSDAARHQDSIKGLLGKDYLNENGQIKTSAPEFLADLMGAAGGNVAHLVNAESKGGVGFGLRSLKMFQALSPEFNEARDAALSKGASKKEANEAGRKAILDNMNKTIATKYDEKDLNRDFAEVMKSSAEQFEGAVRQLKEEIADQLLPVMKEFLPVFRQLIPVITQVLERFASIASALANNPLAGLGAILGASIMKEVAAAQLQSALEKGLSTSLGAAGAVSIASAVMAISVATLAVQQLAKEEDTRNKNAVGGEIAAANALPLLTRGIHNKDELEEAKGAAAGLEASIAERKKGTSKIWTGLAFAGAAVADAATFGFAGASKGVADAAKETKAGDEKALAEAQKTLDAFVKLIAKSSAELAKQAPANPGVANPAAPGRGFGGLGSPQRPEKR
jgi:hypothetical protein